MTRILLAADVGAPRDLGSGTAPPSSRLGSAPLVRGDVYRHTGLASLMVYNGAAWRQSGLAEVADAAARTAISTNHAAALHAGFLVHETSTGRRWEWSGAFWKIVGSRPVLRAVRNAAGSINASAWITVGMDGEEVDNWDIYNPSTGVATLPVKGLWAMSCSLGFVANATGSRGVRWYNAGTGVVVAGTAGLTAPNPTSGHGTTVVAPTVVTELPAGTQLAVQGYQASGAALGLIQATSTAGDQAGGLSLWLVEQTG